MINKVSLTDNRIGFQAKAQETEKKDDESKILPNNLQTRVIQKFDKTANALTIYPAKGLRGHVNSDFYEFLSMGIIPYIAGSAMFMTMFNLVNKHLLPESKRFASNTGKKMALGVLLYGLGKTLSNDLITRPVALATGVDIELPYRNVYYPLPTEAGASANIEPQHQHRKVYDSREFFRKDLISTDPNYGKAYYDNIAKKIGLGENLNDSVTETTPIIQSIISTTKTAKSLASYAWAGLGVGMALQNNWTDFFDAISKRHKHVAIPGESLSTKIGSRLKNFGKNTLDISKSFIKNLFKSAKTLWTGKEGTTGFMKHAGKAWILLTLALTIGGTANVIYKAKHMGKLVNNDLIDKDKESTVI